MKEQRIKKRQIYSGKWYKIQSYQACCDCGLVHYIKYRVELKKDKTAIIWFKCWRDNKKTEIYRKKPQVCIKINKKLLK